MPEPPEHEHTPTPHSRPTDSPTPPAGNHRPRWPRTSPSSAPLVRFPRWDPRHRRWHNAALRLDGRTTIHAVRVAATDSGGQRVAPACHTGHDRGDDSRSLQPIYDQEVTCNNCLAYRVAHDEGRPYDPNHNTWMLPLVPLPSPASWPSETTAADDGDDP